MQRWAEDGGATAVEYAIMVGLIAVVVIAGALALGLAANGRLTCSGTSVASQLNEC